MCKFSLSRSILSKTVAPNELGKALSGIAIVAAAMPFATAPAIRNLYTATLDTLPSSVALLSGASMLLAFELYGLLYLNKENINNAKDQLENNLKSKGSKGNFIFLQVQ